MICTKCGKENIVRDGKPGRGEVCLSCGADLRCCLNCRHYEPGRYNSCREPQAEMVADKGKRNFCDFFSAAGQATGPEGKPGRSAADARSRLEALFKK